jgi:hypothetical protein
LVDVLVLEDVAISTEDKFYAVVGVWTVLVRDI